jgi:hypothetical protein
MARTQEEIEELLAEYREKSKDVAVDVNEKGLRYQENSEIKPARLPWWFVAHIKAMAENAKKNPPA